MGKLADNEQRKLRAAFYNNLAAGLILAGLLIPAMAFTQFGFDLGRWIKALGSGEAAISYDAMARGFIVGGSAAIAFLAARFFRAVTKAEIAKLED